MHGLAACSSQLIIWSSQLGSLSNSRPRKLWLKEVLQKAQVKALPRALASRCVVV